MLHEAGLSARHSNTILKLNHKFMSAQLARQLILRALTSPVTSNFDKHIMLKAAEQIELLQSAVSNLQSAREQTSLERDHWNNKAISTPWEIR